MSNKQFSADVGKFSDMAKSIMLKVARQSIQDVVRIAQTPVAQGGDMPVDTGFLRNSLISTVDSGAAIEGGDSFTLAIAQLQLGNAITFEWSAEYALPRHYMVGVGQGGGLWRDKAAMQWEAIVQKNAKAVAK